MSARFDVAIIGGGMVGGSLACALSGHGLRIAVIESHPLSRAEQPGYDDRTVALAYGSRLVFEALDLWEQMLVDACPIERIHISERGAFGFARLEAASQGVDALGYVIAARSIGRALAGRLDRLQDLQLFSPATLVSLEMFPGRTAVGIERQGEALAFDAKVVVAADGAHSRVRDLLGVGATEWHYGQSAITANVSPQDSHDKVAFERFTPSGPLALLPMTENRCALVYTVEQGEVEALLGLSDREFLARVQRQFGYRLGRLRRVGRRNAHPLSMVRAHEHARAGFAFVGNAAHALHPVAGQGFNLGLRDVAALAEVLVSAHTQREDIGAVDVLDRYARWRRVDQVRTMGFTDALVRLFGNPIPPVRFARNLGLLAFDRLPVLKNAVGRSAMGMADHGPKLAMGLPL